MLSALKLITTGVIVALVSGLAWAGPAISPPRDTAVAATASPSLSPTRERATPGAASQTVAPETRTDLIPGVELITEEVESGVFRVVNDDVRDLTRPGPAVEDELWDIVYDWFGGPGELYTGLDGSVWLGTEGGRSKLGEPGRLKPAGDDQDFWVSTDGPDMERAQAGTACDRAAVRGPILSVPHMVRGGSTAERVPRR